MLHGRPVRMEGLQDRSSRSGYARLFSSELLGEGGASSPKEGYEDVAPSPGVSKKRAITAT